ncbi:hypothetical protein Dda_7494 [Drechslerella dactyloides]|uniref:Uncharacterized protein n=1 Tax=Drechslerella dactyloides TaxID=74499 RepID=A0AAD6ISQ7_DREDA|nr:hypothetical protein Dda_7494 [Drechslerella dactyloides]
MSTASGFAVVLRKHGNIASLEHLAENSAESLLLNDKGEKLSDCRLIPEPSSESIAQYLQRCGNVAVVKDYSVPHSAEALIERSDKTDALEQRLCEVERTVCGIERSNNILQRDHSTSKKMNYELTREIRTMGEEFSVLQKKMDRMEMQSLKIGIGNLQIAAIRRIKKQQGRVNPSGGPSNTAQSSEGLTTWFSKFNAKDLPSVSNNMLKTTDYKRLCDSKLVEERNRAAHQEWGELAVILSQQKHQRIRDNWQRIFKYVVRRSVEAEAEQYEAGHTKFLEALGGLSEDET